MFTPVTPKEAGKPFTRFSAGVTEREISQEGTRLAVYVEERPPPGTNSPNVGDIYESRRLIGTGPLAADGSARVRLPAATPIILQLQRGKICTWVPEKEWVQ